jgi:hypothetical protein
MLQGFRGSGGLVSGDALAAMLRLRCEQPISFVARRIVQRELVHVCWRSEILVPLFQFDPADMALRRGVPHVLEMLAPAYDDWDIAMWFAEPSAWLGGQRPADAIGRDPAGVMEAARADCFLAKGF